MRSDHPIMKYLVITGLTITMAVLPACKKAPDQEPSPSVAAQPGDADHTLVALSPPQSNPDLGITVTGTPPGLVVTYNENLSLELADTSRPDLRYTLFADRPGLDYRSPASAADFEVFIDGHNRGRITDRGNLDTPFGTASWAAGTYFEEEQSFEDMRVFVPHPSGSGTLVVTSVSPADLASFDERLSVIEELLSHLE